MAGLCRDPAVKRLADLADNHEIVHRALPQRAEHIRPGVRKGLALSTEYIAEVFPRIGRHGFTRGEIADRHEEIKNPVRLY
jgi:hypothetical protein